MIYILSICLLIALFFLVSALFISCISSEIRTWKKQAPKKIKTLTFIFRIYIGDVDFRCKPIEQLIRETFSLSSTTRINYNRKTGRYEVDNTNYEVLVRDDYLYIYKRELI